VAALCSALIPGLGQVYNGELWKGITICALTLTGIIFLVIPGLMVWMSALSPPIPLPGR
jgi:TM2 domain-containing membrane protein YozV